MKIKSELRCFLIEYDDAPIFMTVMHGFEYKSHGALWTNDSDRALKFADELSATEYRRHIGLLNSKTVVREHIYYRT